ncbi:MAG: hypothetical protein B9S34_16325 [Opitutia bacterium Tous-C1TDCM]|nr:MAG: hypothetical protein B9S34_16325 [Opitutae bacterium Tous-C1TDCM]
MSFLDCICCGFGAIILIFVLTIGSREKEKMEVLLQLQRELAAQLAEMAKLRSAEEEMKRVERQVTDLVVESRRTNAETRALLDDMDNQVQRQKAGLQALLADIDDLKKELAARQKKPEIKLLPDIKPTPVGLPTESNYIAIVIDTSGSMRDPNHGGLWPIVIRKVDEVLDSYPALEGFQLIDGDGRFILGRRGAGTEGWIADTPDLRDTIKRSLRRYNQDSISNPVPGIFNALRFLYDKDNPKMKMGIYVFGDEFIETADPVIRRLDELNPADENGNRKVVINAIGFPTTIRYTFSMGNTGLKFANLMRTVTYQHGGAFIALQDL